MHAPKPDTRRRLHGPGHYVRKRLCMCIYVYNVCNTRRMPADASTALARALMEYECMYMYVYVHICVFMYTQMYVYTHPGLMPADATTALARPLMFFRCSWERSGRCGFHFGRNSSNVRLPVDPIREDAPFAEIWGFPEIIKKNENKTNSNSEV